MMKTERKKIKKLIIPSEGDERGLVIFGGKPGKDTKMIFKVLDKGVREHYTMMMKKTVLLIFIRQRKGQNLTRLWRKGR